VTEDKQPRDGSGVDGRGIENEGTGSLRIPKKNEKGQKDRPSEDFDQASERTGEDGSVFGEETKGSGSTRGGTKPGVSGKRGMTGGTEKEGEGHSGPIRSGSRREEAPETEQDREEGGAREGYEDQGGSRADDGTSGESSGSRPGYR